MDSSSSTYMIALREMYCICKDDSSLFNIILQKLEEGIIIQKHIVLFVLSRFWIVNIET